MKKIITLLFSIGAFATSFAQYNHQDNNDDRNYRYENRRDGQYANDDRNFGRDHNWGHYNHEEIFSANERDFQIEKINRDFIFQVRAIQSDCYLRHHEKKEAIRNAETERARQIASVNDRFNCRR